MECCKINKKYIAGFFDGEGCVQISKSVNKKYNTVYYSLFITIGNTNKKVMNAIHKYYNFGSSRKRIDKRKNRRPMYYWQATAIQAMTFLEGILPYLIVKKAEAKIAIKLQKILSKRNREGKRRLSKQEIRIRKTLKTNLEKLRN